MIQEKFFSQFLENAVSHAINPVKTVDLVVSRTL